jgi:hypothetical protein
VPIPADSENANDFNGLAAGLDRFGGAVLGSHLAGNFIYYIYIIPIF